MTSLASQITRLSSALLLFASFVSGQEFARELTVTAGQFIEITNDTGRVRAVAERSANEKGLITATSDAAVSENEIKIEKAGGRAVVQVVPASANRRIDIVLRLPERTRIRIKGLAGEILVEGNFETIEAETDTGTIAVDIPAGDVKYELRWLASRPRFLSDFELEPVKEKSGGKFQIKGRHEETDVESRSTIGSKDSQSGNENTAPTSITLRTATQRGIVLINVPPTEVMADLRERPLTNAAKAIIRSGDNVLMDAIRRAAPKYFSDYSRTLPPVKREPELTEFTGLTAKPAAVKRATVHVTDSYNRAIPGLTAADFEVMESNTSKEIISVRPVEAPVNLVLLLDVSGSIENYVTFIRKAAREFVDTVDKNDRLSIVTFRDDVEVLAGFTTDKAKLSESLDSFDAGGPTAYYDALGYALSESLRPLKGDRTAIVVLTDGDDNRSFLPFESLIGAIEESGALVYPLYVPSSLIAASAATGFQDIDPLRNRHLTLTTKANGEGERLARVSGGRYYPITQLSQIQAAYEDIVVQLRTAYDITYRSNEGSPVAGGKSVTSRLRVRVKRSNAFAQIGPVVSLQ